MQTTIAKPCHFTGVALHGGGRVEVRLLPGKEDEGIIFRRVDTNEEIRANSRFVCNTHLATTLRQGEAEIGMVEHLLSAMASVGLDNLIIEVNYPELPILDGSAAPWLMLFSSVGIHLQKVPKKRIRVLKKVEVKEGNRLAAFEPCDGNDSLYQVTIDYPHSIINRSKQYLSFCLTTESYYHQISRARTFCYVNDVEKMQRHNRARGGSLQNAVVYDEHQVINASGLRYDDEFVRHKMLDVIGDCYIEGHLILGQYTGVRPGHDINNKLMCSLMQDPAAWKWENH